MRVGLAGLVGLVWVFWEKKDYAWDEFGWTFGVAAQTAGHIPHAKTASQALSLIPIFILIGHMAHQAGLTRSLFKAAKRWVGWLPGGLGVSSIMATAVFARIACERFSAGNSLMMTALPPSIGPARAFV